MNSNEIMDLLKEHEKIMQAILNKLSHTTIIIIYGHY